MQNAHNNNELINSPRRRQLDNWYVQGYPANDPEITIYRLCGRVRREVDGFEPAFRVTRTSPIVACDGQVITTASGSTYTLGTPDAIWAPNVDPEAVNAIGDKYLNNWIVDQNWLTI